MTISVESADRCSRVTVRPLPGATPVIEPSAANVTVASNPEPAVRNPPGIAGTDWSAGGSCGHTWAYRRPAMAIVCGLRLAQSQATSTVSVAGHGPVATAVSSRGPSKVTLPAGGSPTLHDAEPHFDQRPKMSWVATE